MGFFVGIAPKKVLIIRNFESDGREYHLNIVWFMQSSYLTIFPGQDKPNLVLRNFTPLPFTSIYGREG
jgi:hypothetical protein